MASPGRSALVLLKEVLDSMGATGRHHRPSSLVGKAGSICLLLPHATIHGVLLRGKIHLAERNGNAVSIPAN